MAQEYHADEIGKMVVALSNVFKLSLNKGEKFIALNEELKLVSNYLEIQKCGLEVFFALIFVFRMNYVL